MKIQKWMLIVLAVGWQVSFAQHSKLLSTISTKAACFTTDNLGYIYTVNDDAIFKLNPDGTERNRYSNMQFGIPSSIDAANPLKLVVYYKELRQLVLLDNTLSLQGEPVSFEEIELPQITLVCSSVNSSIWAYDQESFQLIRLDGKLNRIQETGNIGQLLGIELNPNYLVERNNWVYLNDPQQGVLVFDIFGTYYKTIPIKGIKEFQVFENKLIYLQKGKMHSFGFEQSEFMKTDLPDTSAFQTRVEKRGLWLLTPESLKLFSVDN